MIVVVSDTHQMQHEFAWFLWCQTLSEGLLVLGRVKEVQDFKVMVSLPNGLLATLPITAVSDTYTQRLQSAADSNSDDIDVSVHCCFYCFNSKKFNKIRIQRLAVSYLACWEKFRFCNLLSCLMATNINYNIHTQIDRCITLSDYIPLIINMVCVMYGIVFVHERESGLGVEGGVREFVYMSLCQ